MPNKKFMIVVASVLFIILVIIIIFVVRRRQPAPVVSTNEPTNTPTMAPTGSITPTTEESTEQITQPTVDQNQGEPVVRVEHFVWLRVLYYGNDSDSNKVKYYADSNNINEKLVIDWRNVNANGTDLSELKEFSKLCQLSGDPLTNLPLVYDRDYKKCYLGYEAIVAYLNSELKVNENWPK